MRQEDNGFQASLGLHSELTEAKLHNSTLSLKEKRNMSVSMEVSQKPRTTDPATQTFAYSSSLPLFTQ